MRRIILFGLVLSLTLPFLAKADTSSNLDIGERKIVTFKDQASQEDVDRVIKEAGAVEVEELDDNEDVTAVVANDQEVKRLKDSGLVKDVSDDIQLEIQRSSRIRYPQEVEWNMDQIEAPLAWREGNKGQGIKVAIIDSGVDIDHSDLAPAVKAGINTIRSSRDYDDDNGHGTHVAGIIAARDNLVGVVGVAPEADLYIAKALDRRGRGYLSDIIEAIDWAISEHVDVINLSLGTSVDLPPLEDAVDRANAAGVMIVAAAGNSGGAISYPGAYNSVIAVGMVDDSNEVHRRSSRGRELSVVAPGVRVRSIYKNDRYRTASGTSMASPHVAGAIALYLNSPECTSGCNWRQVKSKLQSTATDLGPTGRDNESGYGLINVKKLLSL